MALKPVIESLDDVDEAFRGEYKEHTDPKTKAKTYVLDLDGSIDLHPAARTLKDELARRRISEKEAKDKLTKFSAFGDRDPSEILAELDEIPTLRAAAEGKVDSSKIEQIVESRLKQKLAPIERERDQYKSKAGELEGKITEYTVKERQRMIADAVRSAVGKSKGFNQAALEDVILVAERALEIDEGGNVVTKDGVGVTPGVGADVWLTEMQPKRSYWWGETIGGGALGNRGSAGFGGTNPFTHEHWNMTEQGKLVLSDRKKAEQMAKAAGTTIGGGKPAPKQK